MDTSFCDGCGRDDLATIQVNDKPALAIWSAYSGMPDSDDACLCLTCVQELFGLLASAKRPTLDENLNPPAGTLVNKRTASGQPNSKD